MNVFTFVLNNPKKSVFGTVVAGFVGKWMNGLHKDHQYRHAICRSVKEGGTENVNWNFNPNNCFS